MRAFWSGEIAFGLVTIPAKLYTSTRDTSRQYHQLHKECGRRITTVRHCATCKEDLAPEDIGKGVEVFKDVYKLLTPKELEELEHQEPGGTISIVSFVRPGEVDFAYLEKSYWIGPGSRNAVGYCLLRATLERARRVALAKVKLRTRTHLALVRPRGAIFALDLLRFPEELVAGDQLAPVEARSSARERQLARQLVQTLSGTFDPTRHPDDYRAEVLAPKGPGLRKAAARRAKTLLPARVRSRAGS